MFPPTIIAAPTSASTRPNATMTPDISAKRASRATAQWARQVPAPRVSAVRRTRESTPWTAAAVSAAAIGTASTTSAMTMATQVYSSPSPPSGPRRASNPQINRPTTTVGNASSVLNAVRAARRPQNRVVPTTNPSGTPRPQAMSVATTATRSESHVMPNTSASPPRTSWAPRRSPSAKKSKRSGPEDETQSDEEGRMVHPLPTHAHPWRGPRLPRPRVAQPPDWIPGFDPQAYGSGAVASQAQAGPKLERVAEREPAAVLGDGAPGGQAQRGPHVRHPSVPGLGAGDAQGEPRVRDDYGLAGDT